MRALVFDKTLSFDPRRAEPALSDGDTLLKLRAAGICATDIEITKGYMNFHGVLGHEFVADVLQSPEKDLVEAQNQDQGAAGLVQHRQEAAC